MADARWRHGRLAPEVAGEAADVVETVAQYRPQWLRQPPCPDQTTEWVDLWRVRIYERARSDPGTVSRGRDVIVREHGDVAEVYFSAEQQNRDPLRGSGLIDDS